VPHANLEKRHSLGLLPVSIAVLAVVTGCNRIRNIEDVRSALARGSGVIELPAGRFPLDRPLLIPKGAKNIELRGNSAGSTLVLDAGFGGAAAIEADKASNVTLSNFEIIGDRTEMKSPWYLPLREAPFADYYTANGVVIRNSVGVTIRNVIFSRVRAFPIIINAGSKSLIDSVVIEDSGTLNPEGHNNTTGGILIEEGSTNFEIRGAKISRVAGNAIWTHSYARSQRQADGLIQANTISTVARDAIQIGHATRVRVENNQGADIGFPEEQIDFAGYGTPVALDTAGNVDHTKYANNVFNRVNGQCIDLDGFHDGEVTANTCVNVSSIAAKWLGLHFGVLLGNHDPGMTSTNIAITGNTIQGFAYGGLFLIGDHHRIVGNYFLDANLAHCGTEPVPPKCDALRDQPDALRSGIYLSDNGGRPAVTRDNIIEQNVIAGFGIDRHCIAAKAGIDLRANSIGRNFCGTSNPVP
jgi:hypothetical protein